MQLSITLYYNIYILNVYITYSKILNRKINSYFVKIN